MVFFRMIPGVAAAPLAVHYSADALLQAVRKGEDVAEAERQWGALASVQPGVKPEDVFDDYDGNVLNVAAAGGHFHLVRWLVEVLHCRVREEAPHPMTCLHSATASDDVDLFLYLAAAWGAKPGDVLPHDEVGCSVLHYAKSVKMLVFLLHDWKLPPDDVDPDGLEGLTPLETMLQPTAYPAGGRIRAAGVLIAHGAHQPEFTPRAFDAFEARTAWIRAAYEAMCRVPRWRLRSSIAGRQFCHFNSDWWYDEAMAPSEADCAAAFDTLRTDCPVDRLHALRVMRVASSGAVPRDDTPAAKAERRPDGADGRGAAGGRVAALQRMLSLRRMCRMRRPPGAATDAAVELVEPFAHAVVMFL